MMTLKLDSLCEQHIVEDKTGNELTEPQILK